MYILLNQKQFEFCLLGSNQTIEEREREKKGEYQVYYIINFCLCA